VYHHGWPELFLSPTAPQLLKAAPKASTNGHWPDVVLTKKKKPTKHAASWTAERRAAQGERLKARIAAGKGPKSTTKKKIGLVHRVHAYLKKHGESAVKDLIAGTHGKTSAAVISSMHPGMKSGQFVRTGKGRYALGPKA
jgi:hypothetical protein